MLSEFYIVYVLPLLWAQKQKQIIQPGWARVCLKISVCFYMFCVTFCFTLDSWVISFHGFGAGV